MEYNNEEEKQVAYYIMKTMLDVKKKEVKELEKCIEEIEKDITKNIDVNQENG